MPTDLFWKTFGIFAEITTSAPASTEALSVKPAPFSNGKPPKDTQSI